MDEPRYPIYIVSKGRWEHAARLTSRGLEEMRVRYSIIVEEPEAQRYRDAVDPDYGTVLVLDPAFQHDFDACDDLEESKGKGPGPARNFAWEHSLREGHAWHWVMDDNIARFYRLNRNTKIQVLTGAYFRAMESFAERFSTVAMAGPAYEHMTPRRQARPPFSLNTRIYSCNFIRNDLPFRWRGRYNEDTILSLDMLKAGWCTIQFNAFLQNKVATQRVKGGNTDEFYAKEGTLAKSQMQVRVHPDVSRLVWRFNRWHHHVDYRPFKGNQLKLRPGVEIPTGANEYGMQLVKHKKATRATPDVIQ